MFNVTELFNSANEKLGINRQLKHWIESKGCQELLNYRVNLLKNPSPKTGDGDNQVVTEDEEKSVKDGILKIHRGRVTKEGRTQNKVMADPVMTLDAASYLDVALKNDVYEYYLDNKADERNKMTENYKKFCSVVARNLAKDKTVYEDTCKKINGIVFGKFLGGLWNEDCTKEQYIELNDIMVKLTAMIEDGDIKTVPQMYQRLKRWYDKKWNDYVDVPCEFVK